jgi:hypothetical protein
MALNQPVLSIITAPAAVMMASEVCHSGLPPLVLHACFQGEGAGDLPAGFARHVLGGLVFWDSSRAFSRMLLSPG